MKKSVTTGAFAATFLVLAVLGFWALVPAPDPATVVPGSKVKINGAGTAGFQSVKVSLPAEKRPSKSAVPKFEGSTLHKQFRQAKDYYAFYKALELRSDPEAMFYKAGILDRCRRWGSNNKGQTADQRIQQFDSTVNGPFREIRQEINAKLVAESPAALCASFPLAVTEAEVDAAYEASAQAGDIRGRLDQLHRSLVAGASSVPTTIKGAPFASDAQINFVLPRGPTEQEASLLKQAISSRDPSQIEFAGPLLTAKYSDYELKFGDGNGLVGIPDYFLWKSVACHYAGGCDADSFFVQQDCALLARCDVSTYDEKLQRYIFTEENWRNFVNYRDTLIRIIDTQDWTQLMETRGPRSNLWGTQINTRPRIPRFNLRY